MTRDATTTTPDSPPNGEVWLPVSMAAARLGVSSRSIQRRCASGTLPARRVEGQRGTVWQVEAGAVERARHDERDGDTERDRETQEKATTTATSATPKQRVALVLPFPRSKQRDTEDDGDSDKAQSVALETERLRAQLEASRAEIERERELSRFLKSQIEEGNRNAAELRAALRKALEIAPRQLEQGNANSAPERTQNGAANHVPTSMPDAPKPKRKAPMSYSEIADQLEEMI